MRLRPLRRRRGTSSRIVIKQRHRAMDHKRCAYAIEKRHRESSSSNAIEPRRQGTPSNSAIERRHRVTPTTAPSSNAIEQGMMQRHRAAPSSDVIEQRRRVTPSGCATNSRGGSSHRQGPKALGSHDHPGQDRVDDTKIIEGPRRSEDALGRSTKNNPRGQSPKKMPTEDRGDRRD